MSPVLRLAATIAVAVVVAVAGSAAVLAHEITVKGTVAGIEPKRVQVKTGEEKKDAAPAWYPIDAKTKILRGKAVVTFAEARIVAGERVALTVDHESNGTMRTIDIRLAAR